MEDKSKYPQRRSLRLRAYDYAAAGAYFVTVCTQKRRCLFGNIENGSMHLNDFGRLAADCWLAIPNHFANTVLDVFVVMPNHLHGIVVMRGGVNSGAMDKPFPLVMNRAPTADLIEA